CRGSPPTVTSTPSNSVSTVISSSPSAAPRTAVKKGAKKALDDLRIVCTICATLFTPPPPHAERYCRSARAPASHCSPARSARDPPSGGARRAAARGEFSRDAVEREPRSQGFGCGQAERGLQLAEAERGEQRGVAASRRRVRSRHSPGGPEPARHHDGRRRRAACRRHARSHQLARGRRHAFG